MESYNVLFHRVRFLLLVNATSIVFSRLTLSPHLPHHIPTLKRALCMSSFIIFGNSLVIARSSVYPYAYTSRHLTCAISRQIPSSTIEVRKDHSESSLWLSNGLAVILPVDFLNSSDSLMRKLTAALLIDSKIELLNRTLSSLQTSLR